MTAKGLADRTARLSAALKENIKRRKAQARAKAQAKAEMSAGPMVLGTAPQEGLEDKPHPRRKAAAKPH